MSDALKVEFDARGVATLTFDRPDRMNAINDAMVGQMTRVFTELATRNDCRVVLIRGEGANFSAGGDMGDIATMASADRDERAAAVSEAVENLSRPMSLACAGLPQPVVASVRGHAIGVALQLVLMADLVIASQTAKFSLPQLRLGHTPDHGESWALPRKIGLSRALQMCLLAERIDAATAEAYGLANWVVADDTLEEQTEETIGRLLSLPPLATRNAKRLMRDGLHRSLPEAMDAEIASIREVAAQNDFLEAVRAYSEKRPPVFKGR